MRLVGLFAFGAIPARTQFPYVRRKVALVLERASFMIPNSPIGKALLHIFEDDPA